MQCWARGAVEGGPSRSSSSVASSVLRPVYEVAAKQLSVGERMTHDQLVAAAVLGSMQQEGGWVAAGGSCVALQRQCEAFAADALSGGHLMLLSSDTLHKTLAASMRYTENAEDAHGTDGGSGAVGGGDGGAAARRRRRNRTRPRYAPRVDSPPQGFRCADRVPRGLWGSLCGSQQRSLLRCLRGYGHCLRRGAKERALERAAQGKAAEAATAARYRCVECGTAGDVCGDDCGESGVGDDDGQRFASSGAVLKVEPPGESPGALGVFCQFVASLRAAENVDDVREDVLGFPSVSEMRERRERVKKCEVRERRERSEERRVGKECRSRWSPYH